MRSRRTFLIVLCLLLAAGAWLLWRQENHPAGKISEKIIAAQKKIIQSTLVTVKSSPPKVLPAAMAAKSAAASAATNKFAFRLTNTKKTIGELTGDRRAILLENAFIDTSEPLNLPIPKNLQAQGDPGAYIVQANGPINNAFRAMLAAAGATIVSYIPNDAYLVRVSAGGANVISGNSMTAAVIPYEPYYKLSPSFLTALSQNPDQPLAVSEMRVAAFPDTADEAKAALENSGAKIIAQESSPFGEVFTVQKVGDVAAVAQMASVQLIEPFYTRVIANDLARVTLGISTNTVTATNYMGLTGKNVIVEVNDTGIDKNHPDFSVVGSAESPGPNPPSRIFGDAPESLVDTNGHGTHVAGIIAGNGSESYTVTNTPRGSVTNADFRGKAPDALLYSIGFLGDDTNVVSDRYLQESAANTNALISNNSWISEGDNTYDLAAASYDAAVRDALPEVTGSQPVLFVFAAGNDGAGNDNGGGGDADTIMSPATAKNVITVGAVEQLRNITNIVTDANSNSSAVWQPMTDSGNQVAGYSSRGNVGIGTEGTFGRFKPDVVAPGTFVVSCRSEQWDTNAYYNPTNATFESGSDTVTTNSPNVYGVSVPANAVEVDITLTTNSSSPSPFPNFLIYVALNGTPGPGNYDFVETNQVKIPPDSGNNITGITSIQNGGFSFAVADGVDFPASYNVTVEILTTNDLGNYYGVLEALNDTLAPWYRYETGTSMAAPAISGLLALFQDYFTNTLAMTPSPALLKAMLINGSRAINSYGFALTNSINLEGWGLPNLTNSLPFGVTNNFNAACSSFFLDQNPTNALATGDSHTFAVTISSNILATLYPLRVTLAWTDPPGDPAAAIKLVNSLELVVSNSVTGRVYYGNNFLPSGNPPYTVASNPTNPPAVDSINNVQNVAISPLLSQNATYYVTVIGRSVNVNAVTAQTNNVVQDYALVISCGEGEVTNAITVADNGIVSNPTGDQDITFVTTTNQPFLNQFVGANTPLLGTNAIPYGATNEQITLGMTNQWHFYVVTNLTTYANAAFITFLPDTLATPRMGVFANSQANSTRTEADIDLYVARSSVIANAGVLTNLDPVVIEAADKSLTRGGTEFVAYTNAQPGEVFYIGVQSEDHEGAEYDFIPIFTPTSFGQMNGNGDEYVNGLNVPIDIPDGNPAHPGIAYVFGIALTPIQLQRVVVTNYIQHQNFGDLIGTLSHNDVNDVLNNHDGLGNWPGTTPLIYDDTRSGDIANSQPSDGPGSLQSYIGSDGFGVWRLTEIDDSPSQTGSVLGFSLFLENHQNPGNGGAAITVQPGAWYYDYVDVPVGITNLQIFATNTTGTATLQLYLRYGSQPDTNNYDLMAFLTNSSPLGPWGMISDGPPLSPGRYFIGIFNPGGTAQNVFLSAVLNGPTLAAQPTDFTATNATPLPDDAVSTNVIFISNTNFISSINVGMVVQHPRISDLTFTLVSPSGQRILLMENRGGLTATNVGHLNVITNYYPPVNPVLGGPTAQTNVINISANGANANFGTLIIDYNFYTLPDQIDVYYDGVDIFSIYTNNPGSVPATFTIPYGPGVSTNIVIVMNQNGNTNNTTEWEYTPRVVYEDYNYLTFTEDTNLTTIPIKFAIPPFDLTEFETNFNLCDFELATNGDYFGPTNIYDAYGGWYLPQIIQTNVWLGTNFGSFTNNEASVVSDPGIAFGGSNFLALANGILQRTNFMTPQRIYSLTYAYRGPGISGWWRGEGDALDYADPERVGQNGSLIGRFDFPAGEVSQSFEMENNGMEFDFAGTNSYVQIRQQPSTIFVSTNGSDTNLVAVQSSHLDVGIGPGFTVEGWIDPTNTLFQQPLVEWLARVPTNGSDTNLTIEAGPFLDLATSHYYYLLGATNWTTSETWATQIGGHLATVDTANEENWIYDTFAGYAGTNRGALWIGLNDTNTPLTFEYTSGLTNVVYTNWATATGQPNECTGNEHYVAIVTATNELSGLWVVANNDGVSCPNMTNTCYGVVEVDDIQTNGVQFWISVTNQPGTTNTLVSSNGCLYADLVDTTNGDHVIYSAPGLIQSNVFQHVALTYDTNSGIANLFYNGTNVASTNLGVIIPKTTGDVLLGKDMSLETNNFYGGLMDEMSIYDRALSDAEIAAIYNVSALTTNRLVGKFDASVTPPQSLAEAQVSLGTMTNTIFGENDAWQIGGFTFTALSNSLPMQITGIELGMLFDSFAVGEVPIGDLYYLPEQSLDELDGDNAYGNWTLEIWDNRVGAVATNSLVSWRLQIVLQTNTPPPVATAPQEETTVTVPPGQIVTLAIAAPDWANFATNILVSASSPLNVFFNQTNPPSGNNPPDYELLNNSTAGIGNPILADTNAPGGPSVPPLVPGQTYYIGLQNPGAHSATAVFEVDFDITALSNNVPVGDTLETNEPARYFSFDVSSNAYEATFQLLDLSGNADLVVRKGAPLPTLLSSDYGSFNVGNADENIYVLTNSSPVPLSAGIWYLGVIKRDSGAVNYTVLAKELTNNVSPEVTFIQLTNGVPFDFTAGPGAALTNFFYFVVTNTITPALTNYVGSIHFELYNMTGNGDLTVQTNAPPFAPPFFQSSRNPGALPEFIQIRTNSALTNLAATWYLGVPNNETNLINFTILAVIDTNSVFPAFPGAQGAGAGALGGGSLLTPGGFTNNTVYHVINLNDSGPSSLRDAVSSTNRTIVFDVSGTIYLQLPLLITNSYLTIAGQTAPGDGITVAGQMTAVQSAHDIIIRDMRFCSGGTGIASANGFEGVGAADYMSEQVVAGWTILTNQVSVVTDPTNAYQGSNFLALASGTITRTLPTVIGQTYTVSFAYRGPGIISMWRGEDDGTDSTGTNNFTQLGGVGFANGEVGQGFYFDNGVHRVTAPDAPELNFGAGQDFSIDAWIRAYPAPGNWQPGNPIETIFDKRVAPDSMTQLGYEMDLPSGYLNLQMADTLAAYSWHNFTAPGPYLEDGQWHHIAASVVRDSTNGGNLYVDGQVVLNFDPTVCPGSLVNTGMFRLGNHADTNDNLYTFFNGTIDELSLYNRALSASEVKAIYSLGSAGKFDSNFGFSTNLAEAQINVSGQTPTTIFGSNTTWQVDNITFTATNNTTTLSITGIEPGMLLDSFSMASNTNANDSFQLDTVSNVIADHISAEWSTNEDLSVLNSSNVTVQWSIISDSLNDTNALHGYGSVIRYGGGAVSLHHNLYADNAYASPRLGDDISLDFVNNVIYDWGTNAGFSANDSTDNPNGYTNYLNYVCNYLIASTNSMTNYIAFWVNTNTWVFQTNNFIDSNTNGILDGANTGWNMFTNKFTETNQFPLPQPSVDEAYLAYEKVLDFAGPDMDKRDSVDSNIVENVRTQTGTIISSAGTLPALNSALPYLDTDQDGIPDFWEKTFTPDYIFVPSNNNDRDGDGYTDLEEYDNWLAGPHALTVTNTPVGVDLQQLFGNTGNLSFFVTNAIQGFVYLTNVLNYTNVLGVAIAVTNTGAFSNSFAIFTPTNNLGSSTNYSGYASFDVYVTNNDTVAYFGPETVSIIVSAVPVKINSNMPPVITPLINEVLDPTNYGGSDFYEFTVDTNATGVLFTVTNISVVGGVDLLAKYGLPLPSLSDYDYISTNTANEYIFISANSMPVPLTNGDWYLAVVNVNPSGDPVSYDIKATELLSVYPPVFFYPTNTTVTNIIETVPFAVTCVATDLDTPPLPLTYAIVTNVLGSTNIITINPSSGVINWTPNESQGPSTNSIAVSVSNGAYIVTNSFTIIVEESNLPPVLPSIPDQVVILPGTLVVTNTATDPDIPTNPLTYTLSSTVTGTNLPTIDTNGIITWTPTLADMGSNYVFTTVVTDTNPWAINAKSLSATNSFYVTVLAGLIGGQPQTNVVGSNSITWYAISVPTNAIAATNILLYATNLPVNVWFSTNVPPTITNTPNDQILIPNATYPSGTNGLYILSTNTTPPLVPGGTYYLGVQNTNSVAVAYAVKVDFLLAAPTNAVTNPIFISSIVYTNIGGTNGFLLTWFAPSNDFFQVQWTPSLAPTSWSTFTNIVSYNTNFPASATNAQFNFFDDGSQFPFGPMRFYRLILLQATNTLTLPSQTSYTANVGIPLVVTNTATDSNTNLILTYYLTNSPVTSTPATIDTNGIIAWTPGVADGGGAFKFTTIVTDNGVPPLSATNAFTVFVLPAPAISSAIVTATNVTLQWSAPTNDIFQVEWTTNLTPIVIWTPFPPVITSTTGLFTFTDTNAPLAMKFYRLLWLPLP